MPDTFSFDYDLDHREGGAKNSTTPAGSVVGFGCRVTLLKRIACDSPQVPELLAPLLPRFRIDRNSALICEELPYSFSTATDLAVQPLPVASVTASMVTLLPSLTSSMVVTPV